MIMRKYVNKEVFEKMYQLLQGGNISIETAINLLNEDVVKMVDSYRKDTPFRPIELEGRAEILRENLVTRWNENTFRNELELRNNRQLIQMKKDFIHEASRHELFEQNVFLATKNSDDGYRKMVYFKCALVPIDFLQKPYY